MIPSVTMQAQKEAPPDMQCKDKFLLQSVVAPDGTATKDITADMVGWFCRYHYLFSVLRFYLAWAQTHHYPFVV